MTVACPGRRPKIEGLMAKGGCSAKVDFTLMAKGGCSAKVDFTAD